MISTACDFSAKLMEWMIVQSNIADDAYYFDALIMLSDGVSTG
ncbi:MAG: hypothetical protein ACRDF4_06540 [Rhabdochlamydiaceae bacterium]